MNMIKNFINMFLIILLVSLASKTLANTKIQINQQKLAFDKPPKLSDILVKVANKSNVYWPAAALYINSNTRLEVTRTEVIRKIAIQSLNKQTSDMLKKLKYTIAYWKLGKRLPINIDYDLARTLNKHNPVVTKGNYILKAEPRSKEVYIFGAIKSDVKTTISHKNHTPATEYVNLDMLSTHADKEKLILIQADGRVIQLSTADWDKALVEVMPGSQIYIPFKTTFWDNKAKSLNQQIVTLAVNRVMP